MAHSKLSVALLCLLIVSPMIASIPQLAAQNACPGNLPPRLVSGERGRVLPGDSNRLRAQPALDGRQVDMILGGDAFDVIGGPVCADGYTWWQVEYQGTVGWTAEGTSDEYWLEPLTLPTVTHTPSPTAAPIEPESDVIEIPGGLLMDHSTWLADTAFIVSDELATDISYETIESLRSPDDPGYVGIFVNPAHVRYILQDYPDNIEDFHYPPWIELYLAVDFRNADDLNRERLATLEKMLKTGKAAGEMPSLPFVNAAQIMTAQVQFLEMQNGVGVRYLTFYAQDSWLPDNHMIAYEFLGLTDDGRYYVHAMFPLDVAVLPDRFNINSVDIQAFQQDFQTFLAEEVKKLNAATAADFYPALEDIDAIFESMSIAPA